MCLRLLRLSVEHRARTTINKMWYNTSYSYLGNKTISVELRTKFHRDCFIGRFLLLDKNLFVIYNIKSRFCNFCYSTALQVVDN